MKSRFSSIVRYKKIKLDEIEANLQEAFSRLNIAKEELEKSIQELKNFPNQTTGIAKDFLANRALLDAEFRLIEKNKKWVAYEKTQIKALQDEYKKAYIEYEKFKYLETEELKELLKKQKQKEQKELDEMAVIGYKREAV